MMEKTEKYEQEHIAALRSLAPECALFLRRNGDFPLSAPGKLALYGGGARHTVKGGTGSGDVNSRYYVTAEKGLSDAGFTITTTRWLDAYDAAHDKAHEDFINGVKARARREHRHAAVVGMGAVMAAPEYDLELDGEGDTAVYVLSRCAGEGGDRTDDAGDFTLTESEIQDILAARERYDRFILVLNTGAPVDLSPVMEVENILLLSQLGVVTGTVLADILLGYSQPSGKLSATWTSLDSRMSVADFGTCDETRYREGIFVGYRYYEAAGVKPLFPFGFGLGYTDFALGASRASLDGRTVTVETPVFNAGRFPGRETVQVYVGKPQGKLSQPVKVLAAYAKTEKLAPGEAGRVTAAFDLAGLASFHGPSGSYILEKGRYIVYVGTDSAGARPAAVVELDRDVTTRTVAHVGGEPDFEDWTPPERGEVRTDRSVPVLRADAGAFSGLESLKPAQPSERAVKRAKKLTDEELIFLCCGRFSGGPLENVIGASSVSVAGAAGETYGGVRDVPPLVMADGPAGLRLTKRYFRDKNGDAVSLDSTMPAGLEEFIGRAEKFLLRLGMKKPRGEILYQYCTAVPIATALAQSWDPELCRRVGEIVGEEMDRFGVHLWLAPAMNIQRSPLCGRNFEYYSEDPLLTGLTAAAVTLGVQSKPGRGVTVKHFCCNNQETNRLMSNSLVSERALREIYVKGFEICIRAAAPAAVMTSYNLLNGVHTSERPDLSEGLLRWEWGWDGLIMTDWVVGPGGGKSKYRMALSAPSVAAGNVFMPGSAPDWKAALKALREGSLKREDAERCAAFTMDTAWKLRGNALWHHPKNT